MEVEQFTIIKTLLEEIRDAIKEQQTQSQTKITVVGNKAQTYSVPKAKGFDPKEDFEF